MKKLLSTSWVAAALLYSDILPAEEPRGHRPVRPHELIAHLPDPPEGWTTTRSTAETNFDEWLQTRAVREFEKIPSEGAKGPPAKTKIRIVDTAAFPGASAMFDDFQPGQEEDYEKKFIDGHPAFLIPFGEKEHETLLLVGERFLVTLVLENQPDQLRKRWLQRIDLAALAALPQGEMIDFPEVVRIVRIDQLHPERNRIYTAATTSASRLEEELIEEGEDVEEDRTED